MPEATIPLPHRAKGRKGPPLVFLHGFGGDQLAFVHMLGPLSSLRRVMAFDLPGHGAAADWPETPDAAVCAKAVLESLDALNIPRATLIGHSMGGAVAGIAGLMRPDLVERLILLSPGGFGPEINARLLRRYASMTDEPAITLVMEQFFGTRSAMPEPLAGLVAEQRADPAVRASLPKIVKAITKGDEQGTMPLDKLAASPFPVSVVWGTQDAVLPVYQGIEAPALFARHFLPGVGHMPHIEAAEDVMTIIRQALTGRA